MLSKKRRLPIADFFGPQASRYKSILKGRCFSLKIYPTNRDYSQVGVVLSKKIADKASVRNRLKRIFFGVFQQRLGSLPIFDYLCIPTSAAAGENRVALESDLNSVLSSLTPNP